MAVHMFAEEWLPCCILSTVGHPRKLAFLSFQKASGPNNNLAWLYILKENADILAPVVTNILKSFFIGVSASKYLETCWYHTNSQCDTRL